MECLYIKKGHKREKSASFSRKHDNGGGKNNNRSDVDWFFFLLCSFFLSCCRTNFVLPFVFWALYCTICVVLDEEEVVCTVWYHPLGGMEAEKSTCEKKRLEYCEAKSRAFISFIQKVSWIGSNLSIAPFNFNTSIRLRKLIRISNWT